MRVVRGLDEEFQAICASIDPGEGDSIVILVSSACENDGAKFLACGVARAYAELGYRSALADFSFRNPAIGDQLGVDISEGDPANRGLANARVFRAQQRNFETIAFSARASRNSRALAQTVSELRSLYEITVIAADALPTSNLAFNLAHQVDAVLIATQLGRRLSSADVKTKRLLSRIDNKNVSMVAMKTKGLHVNSNAELEAEIARTSGIRSFEVGKAPLVKSAGGL